MRIAQVAPLGECVPPLTYGGSELVVGLLTNELVQRGHDVTLFATADSTTLAQLEPSISNSFRQVGVSPHEAQIYNMLQLSKVYDRANEFDIIHSHIDFQALPYANLVKTPTVHTLHGIFVPLIEQMYVNHKHQNFISISNSQRRMDLGLNYVATVYNGVDPTTFIFHPKPDDPPYLAFLGRISPEKGTHLAIEIAKRTGWHLKIAAKIDRVDMDYYEQDIKPHIDSKQIEFLGEANHVQKNALMGGAVATLFPITWQEPFGLVMTESMVSGTPVIAMSMGSAPEIIAHGKTGFLCHTVEDCIEALAKVAEIDRYACRQHIEQGFSLNSMVDGYEAVYQNLLADQFSRNGRLQLSSVVQGLLICHAVTFHGN